VFWIVGLKCNLKEMSVLFELFLENAFILQKIKSVIPELSEYALK